MFKLGIVLFTAFVCALAESGRPVTAHITAAPVAAQFVSAYTAPVARYAAYAVPYGAAYATPYAAAFTAPLASTSHSHRIDIYNKYNAVVVAAPARLITPAAYVASTYVAPAAVAAPAKIIASRVTAPARFVAPAAFI